MSRLGLSRPLPASLASLVVAGLTSIAGAMPAFAAPVYEITVEWAEGTPSQLAPGDVATAEWRVNVNDDAPAPSNDPVDNVTFTATATNGLIESIPDVCRTEGVDPTSSISADGSTLVCNTGTQNMGVAVAVQVPVVADGTTGDALSLAGEIDGQSVATNEIPIVSRFGMDMTWESPTSFTRWLNNNTVVRVDYQWTLNLLKGSANGPNSVSYTLDLSSIVGGSATAIACQPFAQDDMSGHPWSGGAFPSEQTAPFVGSCTLTPTGVANRFTMTLTGIDYSLLQVPTKDSAGNNLPIDRTAVASGRIVFDLPTTTNGSLSLTSSAPTYTSVSGATSTDDASNNVVSKAFTLPGAWASAYYRGHTGQGGTNWDFTYRAAPGTTMSAGNHSELHTVPANLGQTIQQCTVLDSAFVTYAQSGPDWAAMQPQTDFTFSPSGGTQYLDAHTATFLDETFDYTRWYYVGTNASVTPGSGSYDPGAFAATCDVDPGGWTTTLPGDLSTIKAVRTSYPVTGEILAHKSIIMVTYQTIKATAPVGQDIWQFSSFKVGAGAWIHSTTPASAVTPTPGTRYPYTTAWRDVVRVVGVAPYVEKSSDRSSVVVGDPAVFTIGYAANGGAAAPATADDFVITDTLPLGMAYVGGSASPEPVLTTNGSGQQILTWTLDGVPTNQLHALTYEAVATADATPGQTLTNTVRATVAGIDSAPRSAQVTVSTNGSTSIGKTADEAFIPNVDGDGVGEGSWTVTLRSFDPTPQAFTDTIDVLPYIGDGRGTAFSGSYELTAVTPVAGATVYYTQAAPGTLVDDPADPSNGAAGDVSGNTVGWTTTFTPSATAVRVIGPELEPAGTQAFTVAIETAGAVGGDVFVNRAQARAEHTELAMRTSASIQVANFYSASVKKFVQDTEGVWHDANTVEDYPVFRLGDEVPYRIVVTNTGQGALTNVVVEDDRYPGEGGFTIADLAPGASETHEFTITLGDDVTSTFVNTASASADVPSDSEIPPTINVDPAGIEVANYTTAKSSDPASGETVRPGDTITYTIAVASSGSAPAVAELTDTLVDVSDDATYNGDLAASIGTATIDGDAIAWSGTVPAGEVALITYSVKVKSSAALAADGDYLIGNEVTSPGCEGDCATGHQVADFQVVKASDPADGSNVDADDTIAYTVTVTQLGEAAYDGASLTDDLSGVLDDATWNDDLAASAGDAAFDAGTQQLTWSDDLAVGDVVTITYSITVLDMDDTTGDTRLHNVVASPGCRLPADCETEHFTASYTTVKTADPASGSAVQVGDVIEYTVTVTQSGEGRVVGQFFNDDLAEALDDATFNDDIVASSGSFTFADGVIAWTGDLGPSDVATVTYSVTVTAAGDTLLGNTVSSPGCETPEDCTTNHETGRYQTVKTADPASGETVQIGDTIEYTVTVTQVGAAGVDQATFTDDLTAVLDDATWNDDLQSSAGSVGYAEPAVDWSGSLDVGDVVTVTYSVIVTGVGDMALDNVVTSAGCELAADCVTNHVTGDYTVSKMASAASGSDVAVDGVITYTVTVSQRGPGSVTGATASDDLSEVLDDAAWNDDATATGGTLSGPTGDLLTWQGDLAVGEVVTITYSVTVTGDGDTVLSNEVDPGAGECVAAPDQTPDCRTTHQTGRFEFSKMADPAHNSDVSAGDVITYTVTVEQVGAASVAASLSDDLAGVLDDATWNDDATASLGAVVLDGSTLSWTGDLGVAQVATITYSVTVTGTGDTTIANVVTTDLPSGACVTATDGTEECRTVHKTGGYVYDKVAAPAGGNVDIGDVVTYTVTVTQRGEAAVADATVVDDLSDVLDDATWNGDENTSSGSLVRSANSLTWTGDLSVGQVVTLTYSVTVADSGDDALVNVVSSPDARSLCDPDGACRTNHSVSPPAPALAATGTDAFWPAVLAAVLVLIGGAVLLITQVRRSTGARPDEVDAG